MTASDNWLKKRIKRNEDVLAVSGKINENKQRRAAADLRVWSPSGGLAT